MSVSSIRKLFPSAASKIFVAASFVVSLSTSLEGCASSSPAQSAQASETQSSSGGEGVVSPFTHLAVPVSPVPRSQLAYHVQEFWSACEEVVAQSMPSPIDTSREAIDSWAAGPFRSWLEARRARVERLMRDLAQLENAPAQERGLALGLLAHVYEDTARTALGSPAPNEVAEDAELLAVYRDALRGVVRPIAIAGGETYALCAQTFDEYAGQPEADGAWREWFDYCAEHGRALGEEFLPQTTPAATPAPTPAPTATK